MDALPQIAAGLALAAFAVSLTVLAQRHAAASLRIRLLQSRHDELRRAARSFIGASRESPHDVCLNLDRSVRALVPRIDTVLFLERTGGELVCSYAAGSRAQYFSGGRLSLERDHGVLTESALECRRISSNGSMRGAVPGDRAFLCVPLIDGGQCTAVFYAASREAGAFEPEDDIVTLVDLATPAHRIAVDRDHDRRRATVDGLTGLLSPGAFRAELAALFAVAQAGEDVSMGLLFIDTDHFKACNDTLGHAAGDAVLRTLARLFASAAGTEALIARNGGDEFCILYTAITKTDAVKRAERIRLAVQEHPFDRVLGKAPAQAITASIGVAAYPADAATWEELIEHADQAMYHSKRCGRNRVSFFGLTGTIVDLSDKTAGALTDAVTKRVFRSGPA